MPVNVYISVNLQWNLPTRSIGPWLSFWRIPVKDCRGLLSFLLTGKWLSFVEIIRIYMGWNIHVLVHEAMVTT